MAELSFIDVEVVVPSLGIEGRELGNCRIDGRRLEEVIDHDVRVRGGRLIFGVKALDVLLQVIDVEHRNGHLGFGFNSHLLCVLAPIAHWHSPVVAVRHWAGVRRPPKLLDHGSSQEEDVAVRDDFAMANEQVGLAQSAVQLLQSTIRNGGKDMVFEVILHPGSHEVILQPPGRTSPSDPVHGICLAQARIEMLGDRLQAKNHRVHADDRHEPEDHVEQDPPADPLKEDELAEDYQLRDNFSHQELRPGQQAGRCARRLGRARDPTGCSPECRHPEEILEQETCQRTTPSRDQIEDPIRITFLPQVAMVEAMRRTIFLHRIDRPEGDTPVADPVIQRRDLASRPCEPSCRITPKAFILSPIKRTNRIPAGIDQARARRGRRLAAARRIATSTHNTPIAVNVSGNDCSESDWSSSALTSCANCSRQSAFAVG